MKRSRRASEGREGYALITILVMLAIVGLMLARSLPRDAMRAQRTREETLIFRGEQYSRAVKLYFREHKKYPESLDDLEETNNVRYLRRRYKDPITGEDEWRLVKMGTDGRFKDSLLYDTEDEEDEQGTGGFGFGNSGSRGRQTAQAQPMSPAALLGLPGASQNAAKTQRESAAPVNPFARGQGPFGGAFPGQTAPTGQPQPGQPQTGQPGADGPTDPNQRGAGPDYSRTQPGRVPATVGQRLPNGQPIPGFPGQPTGGFGARTAGRRQGQQPTAAGGQPQGFGREGISSQASDVISRLLTTPRPGGLAGLQGRQGAAGGQQASFQEGIAGVASTAEESGVKVYKGYEQYNEWEFVYDYREDAAMANMGMGGAPGAGGGNLNTAQPGLTPSGFSGNPGTLTPPGGVAIPGMRSPGGATGASLPGMPGTAPVPGVPYPTSGDQQRRNQRNNPVSPAAHRPGAPPFPGIPTTPLPNMPPTGQAPPAPPPR